MYINHNSYTGKVIRGSVSDMIERKLHEASECSGAMEGLQAEVDSLQEMLGLVVEMLVDNQTFGREELENIFNYDYEVCDGDL